MNRVLLVSREALAFLELERKFQAPPAAWELLLATTGPKALDLLAREPIDVLVCDVLTPGLDGAQLLTEVMRRHPQVVRIVLSGQSDREAQLRLLGPAHQYLSKPCDPHQLREVVERAVALRSMLADEQLKQLISRLHSLPCLPSRYVQLLHELRSEDPSLDKVGEIISRDMGLSAKILQLVNSAFFGLAQPVADPLEAAAYLGIETVKALVLSIQVFCLFQRATIKEFSFENLWNHCWVTGVLAKRIAVAENLDAKTADQCFVAGLLHDAGKLVIAYGLPDQFRASLTMARQKKIPLWQAERETLGSTHAEIGAYLLALWGLPNSVVEPVALHHRPAFCRHEQLSPALAVHVANSLDHDRYAGDAQHSSSHLDHDLLASLNLTDRLTAWRRCGDNNEVRDAVSR